ncbi:MAG: methyltransferase domain-containing protein, partial [Flavobacteriales bacterium]|nr:methyltransferase domain-containing protein [Flavobacteriales bacterium]
VREKEQRIYSDEVVENLPITTKDHPQYEEWKLRQKSTNRFTNYLENKSSTSLLEIGCGNGWFIHQCSQKVKHTVGVDINLQELEQAAKLFANTQFIYWDLFEDVSFKQQFDIIVLNAVVQYFSDFDKLIDRLTSLLSVQGEIHIIDSPFYLNDKIEAAKERTDAYYRSMNVPEMSVSYHHHSVDCIKNFETLYTPETSKIKQLIKGKDMPFGWYKKITN